MPILPTLRPFPYRAVRIFSIALTLALPVTAHADFASDIKEPVRLMEAKQFEKALVLLEKIEPQYQDQFALHYMIAWLP